MLLGPATVALAVPLYANLHRLSKVFWPLLISLLLGSLVGIVSSAGVAWALGLDDILIKSLLSRSVSTPISMGIASEIGGAPELAAVFVIVSGVFGAMLGWPLLSRLRLGQDVVYGFATGMAAHGIGTARAFQRSDTAGAFSGLAMGLNGLVTAILIPLLLRFWH
jgi:putative effector of murein hydrolase